MRNTLREFLIVIAAVAKVSCKHGLWLVTRVNQNALPETHRICGFRQGVFSFILYSSEQL